MVVSNVNEIIIVEDNLSDARLTIMALSGRKLANRIVHLKDGQQAIDYLYGQGEYANSRAEITPCFILLDLKMPKVSGIEVLKRLKSEEKTRKIPVVIFTSSQEVPDVKTCYELCVNSYIVKPLDFDSFTKVVEDLGMYWVQVNHPSP